MKLKQKAFITVFSLTIVITTLVGAFLLDILYSKNALEEQAIAAQKLNATAAELDDRLSEQRNNGSSLLLSKEDIEGVALALFGESEEGLWLVTPTGEHIGRPYFESAAPDRDTVCFQRVENGAALVVSRGIELDSGRHILNYYFKSGGHGIIYYALLVFAAAASISLSAALGAVIFAAGIERKLSVMASDADDMVSDRSARIAACGQPELDRIASAVNASSDALADDMEKLKTIADGRKQFVDNLAHEMKTPLTSILGFADILRIRRSVDDRARMEYAGIIFEEARRLRGLSGKLLELTTAGNARLDFELVELPSLFEEIHASILPLITQRKITLRISAQKAGAKVDRELFKSLICNLIENAIKASADESEVRLGCENNGSSVRITVADDGCGMTGDQIRRAAEPFYMADKSRSRKAGGAGLGLALCAEIAQRHRARLTISSKLGKGTTVTLVMPSADEGNAR